VDCFGVRLAISLSVSPSATQRDESTSARGLRAAARFPRPQRPWVFFGPSGTAALPSKPAGRLAKPSAWQWPCRSASRCWTSFLRLTVGVAFLWKSCAFLLVKKRPCNRKGGRLPFAARGNSW